MKGRIICAIASLLAVASTAYAQKNNDQFGQGGVVVTVLPNHSNEQGVKVTQQDIRELKVDGKDAEITGFTPLRGANSPVELVFLIDSGARTSLGTQTSEIVKFIKEMPPDTKMAIAYMVNGTASFSGPLSSNPAQVLQALHITAGPIGVSASPYFCLSDLAKHWPSDNRSARRVVIMISNGIDEYDPRYDPDDPYVQAALNDSVRNGLVVYFLYWADAGRLGRRGFAEAAGQNLMLQVTDATGGYSYWEGFGNPVTFQPYLQDVRRRLDNQYGLEFTVPLKEDNPQIEHLNLKMSAPSAKVDAPQSVLVHPAGMAQQ